MDMRVQSIDSVEVKVRKPSLELTLSTLPI